MAPKGGRILFLNSKEAAQKVYPEYITGWIIPTEGDIVVMERNDAPVFDGIGALELRYFNNNKREIPLACTATLKAIRHENVKEKIYYRNSPQITCFLNALYISIHIFSAFILIAFIRLYILFAEFR